MISAEVIKGVQELLEERGTPKKPEENFGDYVARSLGISGQQAEILLRSLHDGGSVEEAAREAGIEGKGASTDLLTHVARAIGSALGRVAPQK